MARELDQDELIERWTLIGDDLERVASKRSAAKLGSALLLKFFAAHGRFPRGRSELPSAAVEFVAKQLRVPASDLGFYDWSGRSIERHRAEIREALGFRECSVADADKLTDWLVTNVTQAERRADQVRADLLMQCREEGIEPPTPGRVDRIVRSALHQGEQLLFARITARLSTEVCARLDALVTVVPDHPGEHLDERDVLAWVSRSGSVEPEHDAGRDRQTRSDPCPAAAGRLAGRCRQQSDRSLAGACCGASPEPPTRARLGGALDAAGGVAGAAAAGDHRQPGGAADLDGAHHRCPRRPAGDRGDGELVQAGPQTSSACSTGWPRPPWIGPTRRSAT
jgi:hypothetical protein